MDKANNLHNLPGHLVIELNGCLIIYPSNKTLDLDSFKSLFIPLDSLLVDLVESLTLELADANSLFINIKSIDKSYSNIKLEKCNDIIQNYKVYVERRIS